MSDLVYVETDAIDQFRCPVCRHVFRDPVMVCKNEHHVCKPCSSVLEQRVLSQRECPECGQRLRITKGQKFLKRMVEQLLLHCPNRSRGCNATLKSVDLQAHLSVCPDQIITCKWCDTTMERQLLSLTHHHCNAARFGCSFVAQNELLVDMHATECSLSKCHEQFASIESQIAELKQSCVPSGTMLPWCGKKSQMPTGWSLCDGRQGRPDLEMEFQMTKRRKRANAAPDVLYSFAYISQRHDDDGSSDAEERWHPGVWALLGREELTEEDEEEEEEEEDSDYAEGESESEEEDD